MSAKREEIDRITAVMKKHSEQLWSYPNVVGFGVGFKVRGGKKLDRLAIIVFVKKKVPRSDLKRHEIIPADVEEVLTDVQESGEIFACLARTDKWRPAPPGISIGHPLITAGTFGCVVLKDGIRKILSNNHVLANCNVANVGDAIYQPGAGDGGGPGDTLALLEDWVPIVFSPVADNLIDAAIADPIDYADILDEILDIGIPTDVVAPALSMSVVKSGRTSAISYGTITAIHATVSVNYGAPGTARFIDQIITDKMIWPGDSGSLLLTHPEHEAVGLCFAASDVIGVASDIQYAESLLGISILTEVTGSVDLYAKFVVGQGTTDLLGETEIRQPGSSELSSEVGIRHSDSVDLQCRICVECSVDLYCRFDVGQDSRDLPAGLVVTRVSEDNLFSKAVIRHVGAPIELLGIATIVDVGIPVELFGKFKVSYVVALIELEPGSSKIFAPKIHSLNSTLVELEPGSSKIFAPKIHSLNSMLVELEPGSSSELALRFRSLTGASLDAFGGPLSHYKPDYIRSREGEALDVYGGPLAHYKLDYLRSREGSEFSALWSLWGDWRDLNCGFEVGQDWADLYGRLETGQDSAGLLAKIEIPRGLKDLLARFESQTTQNLLAKAEVGQGSWNLPSRFIVRHIGTPVELLSKATIAHTGVPVELHCSVSICQWSDLKGRLCIPKIYDFSLAAGVAFWWWGSGSIDQQIDFEMRSLTGSWVGKFYDGPAEWRLIYLKWDDLTEVDIDGSRPDKSNIIGFFWTYHTPGLRRLDAVLAIEEPLFWHTDLCVADVYFYTQVIEKWNWDEQSIITTILADTYTRLSFWVPGGNGGWQYAGTNYGTSDYLRCSTYYDRPPGSVDLQIDDEEIFIKFALSSIGNLDRLGWARVELFRYYGHEYAKSRLNARRIAQCDETGVTYTYWNFDNVIGGCESGSPHSATPPHAWDETLIRWVNTGRYHLTMGSIWWYMGLPGFRQSSPTSHWGLTTDNNVWDMIRVDEILASWLDGTYRNEGFAIRGGSIDGGDSTGEMNTFFETPRFYSSRATGAATAKRPRLRLQYIPEASINLWSFASADRWQINLTDPHRGAGSLHLIDWTKVSYDRSRTNTSKATLQTDLAFAEGCVDTVCRLNNATYPQLMYGAVYPPNQYVGYTTPIDNFFRVYFRYQDSNNYYRIHLRPAGETSTIIRRRNGYSTTLETFDSGIAVGDWERIRVFWVESAEELHICCYIWDGDDWSFLAGYADVNNYWPAGGDVAFESYDAELDDTEVSERIFP